MNNGFNPAPEFNNQYPDFNNQYPDYNGGNIPAEPDNKKKTNIMIIAAVAAVVIVFVIIFALILGGSYKKPFNRFIKGINKNDIELSLEQLFTEDMMDNVKDDIEDETDGDWQEFCDDAEEAMEEMKEYLEDDYGKNVKFSVKFLNKKDAKKRELKNIEKLYNLDDDEIEIKKAYKVKVELRIKGKDDDEDMKLNLYSVNIKGEGWKIMVDDEFIDEIRYDIEDIVDTGIYEEIIDDVL